MGKLYDLLIQDYRIKEGLIACINCGTCTAVCPAAEFYKYNPKNIVDIVQNKDEEEIEALLKSDTIWYCGECMSCVSRCPRKNAPALVVMALRTLSVKLGYFTYSEKGRQQYPLMKILCNNILDYGYCIHPKTFSMEDHPEYGTVGEWILENKDDVYERVGANYDKEGGGALRKISQNSLDDLKAIFEITGATEQMKWIEENSLSKAKEFGCSDDEYFSKTYNDSSDIHFNN